MIPLLVATASAYSIVAKCAPAVPVESQPRNGATDVPVDVVPALAFSSPECGAGAWSLVLTRTEDGVEVARSDEDDVSDGLAEVFPSADLDPDTSYTLSAAGWVDAVATFTTGSGTAGEHPGAPTVVSVTPVWAEQVLSVDATAAPAGDGDALLVFLDEGQPAGATVVSGGATGENQWSTGVEVAPASRCVSVLQRDLRGELLESEELCEAVGCGCSHGGSGAPAGLGLVLAALAGARKRR